jgi:branched-chain amino acid aminotransferase
MIPLIENIPVTRTAHSRLTTVDFNNLDFGKYIADHMAVADYANKQWGRPSIVPYGELPMTPAMLALHYGQAVFEGMKAFRTHDGDICIFRMYDHHKRLNRSLERMSMPPVSEELFVQSLHQLIELDAAWVPEDEGSSLYIRPVVFASENRLGVKISDQYKFVVMTSPVGPYFNKAIRVKVEEKFVRAAEGGTGYAKCAGNYGGAFYPTQLAREQGFDQVLWTDAREHKYIDESGAMNVMFVRNGKLLTPRLTTALLDGLTRASILTLARDQGIITEEIKISIADLLEGFRDGSLTEAFGAGTAAVVAPIAIINIHGTDYALPPVTEKSIQMKMKKSLHDLRHGRVPDTHNWNYLIRLS